MISDERLARLVGSGSEWAFGVLYQRYHSSLYGYCRSIVRDEIDAQDALQSAFAGALAALKRGQRDAPVRPWLFRITHNEAVSLLRRGRPDSELSEELEQPSASVEEQAHQRARLALLVADLHELPERQRGALLMRELSGLSHEEIAIALGTSAGTAKQTIFEARRSLSEFEEGRRMACEEIQRAISDADGRALRARRVRSHMRDCATCAAFAAAIPARGADLRALAPPLPAAAAAALAARAVVTGSNTGGGGIGGIAVGVTGKTATAILASKVLTGVAIVGTAAVAATVVVKSETAGSDRPATAPAGQAVDSGAASQRAAGGSATSVGGAGALGGFTAVGRSRSGGAAGSAALGRRAAHLAGLGSRSAPGAFPAAAAGGLTAAGAKNHGASGAAGNTLGSSGAVGPAGASSRGRALGRTTAATTRGHSSSHSSGRPAASSHGGTPASPRGNATRFQGTSSTGRSITSSQSQHASNGRSDAQGGTSSSAQSGNGATNTSAGSVSPPPPAVAHRAVPTPSGQG